MADPNAQPQDEQRGAPPPGANGEDLPSDPEALKALLLAERKKYGTILNENKTVKKARDQLSERMKVYLKLEDQGHTPEEIEAILSKQHEDDLNKARDKGEIDKLLENQRKTLEKQLKQRDEMIEQERGLNNRVLLDAVLREELAKVCDPDLLDGAFALHRPKITMIEDPEAEYGRRSVALVGGEHMTVPEFVKHWAENDERAVRYLKPSLATGGGAGGGGGGGRARVKARKEMSPLEKSQYIRQHGKAEYDKLPWSRDGAAP